MKIGVDVRWMVNNYRGMGRFARQFIHPIKSSVLALSPAGFSVSEWPAASRGMAFFPWWEQMVLPGMSRDFGLDYLICPYNTGPLMPVAPTQLIVVVHDLIFMQSWLKLPPSVSLYQTLGRVYRRAVVPRVVRQAEIIVTVSEYTRTQLIDCFGLDDAKIVVIPNSIKMEWLNPALPLASRKPYVFTVAGEPESKNVRRLLKAFSLMIRELDEPIGLKVAGIRPPFHHRFRRFADEFGVSAYVEFLGYVSNSELVDLYRNARMFVFASTFEGFGIPVLEAMASGTPLVCSNTTSIPEVAGDCAYYFDPYDVENMAMRMSERWTGLGASCINVEKGLARAVEFSDNAVMKKLNDFWRELGCH